MASLMMPASGSASRGNPRPGSSPVPPPEAGEPAAKSGPPYWSQDPSALISALLSTPNGLTAAEAAARLAKFGPNALRPHRQASALRSFVGQFTNPLVIILIFAAVISSIVGDWTDAVILLAILVASAVLSFVQEYSAGRAVERLKAQVTVKATVLRDGRETSVPAESVVPGDVVLLSAGSLIPADGVVLEARDFHVNQAVLTGETFPVEKEPGPVTAEASLPEQTNVVFMGTSVRSGTARALIVETGIATEFGQIAERLTLRPPETEFERGIRHFGYLLTRIMALLVLAVLAVNMALKKPVIDSLLFAIALAVGITPELLPAVISVSLARGAQNMARSGVIVRRLNAIENLGSMDTLCTDKTGTITEGVVRLDAALDANGAASESVMRWAYLNAVYQTGLANPLDQAILSGPTVDTAGMEKLDEIPYDFIRKRLSVVVDSDPGTPVRPFLITKGALEQVLAICSRVRTGGGSAGNATHGAAGNAAGGAANDGAGNAAGDASDDGPLDAAHLQAIMDRYARWSTEGYRVLGLATREVARQPQYTAEADERDMVFTGFLLFFDPPRGDAVSTLQELSRMGVQVKIITGDNRLVARHVAEATGLPADSILAASALHDLTDEALWHVAEKTAIFAEVNPNQKERIIQALRKMGHVVGYMGDGINDAPALHAADIGISVSSAVDVAREAADFVLLEPNLSVLLAGIREGRRTFANTIKYIFTTTSANFGNMLSMAGASLFLPFLPLLAKQILLNNFLSDFPAMGIPGDNVDDDMVERPHRWNIRFIRSFMIIFGIVSSLFDYSTFALLLLVAHATEATFQTGWFIESLLTELVVALIVRTRKPFFRSRPGRLLWLLTLGVSLVALAIPYLPIGPIMGFTPLPLWLLGAVVGLTVLYVAAAEVAKKYFYSRFTW